MYEIDMLVPLIDLDYTDEFFKGALSIAKLNHTVISFMVNHKHKLISSGI